MIEQTVSNGYLKVDRKDDKITILDYVPGPPHVCGSSTGGDRCDTCFGGLYGKKVVELTMHGPFNITPERRAELVEWLHTLTKIVELDTEYPKMKKTFTFYEGASQ